MIQSLGLGELSGSLPGLEKLRELRFGDLDEALAGLGLDRLAGSLPDLGASTELRAGDLGSSFAGLGLGQSLRRSMGIDGGPLQALGSTGDLTGNLLDGLDGGLDGLVGFLGDSLSSSRLNKLLDRAASSLGDDLSGVSFGVDFETHGEEARLAAMFRRRLACLGAQTQDDCTHPLDLRLGVELDAIDLQMRAAFLGGASGSGRDAGAGAKGFLEGYVECNWREQTDLIEPDEWSTRVVLEAGHWDQIAVSVEYVRTDALESPLEQAGTEFRTEFRVDPTDRLVGSLRYSRPLRRHLAENETARMDFALSYEELSDDLSATPPQESRWLADLTFTRKLADRFSLLLTSRWASQPEFLLDRGHVLSGRLTLHWKVPSRWSGSR